MEYGIEIECMEGLKYLAGIADGSIDLVLTDPPYIISRASGMNEIYKTAEKVDKGDIDGVKTEEEWENYKGKMGIVGDEKKGKFLKYGSVYGKKYGVMTDYGEWDSAFTMEQLEQFVIEYYKKLRSGGTLIIFFDLWKITVLKEILEKCGFKQIRFIEWIKTNPQPLNSKLNYLTNCREIALVCVKDGKGTFNSKQDNGIYMYPLQGGRDRFHPTQKSLVLFEELVRKHSNDGDVVLDTFLGSGTTAVACRNTGRRFKGCEVSREFYERILERVS